MHACASIIPYTDGLLARLVRDGYRGMPRSVAANRNGVERTKFLNLRDVSSKRQRRHEILVAQRCGNLLCVEMAAGAVALQRPDRAWVTSDGVPVRSTT